MSKNEINDLPNAEQSASHRFLTTLKSEQPNITLHQFSEVAQKLKRIDVFNCIKGWPEPADFELASISKDKQRSLVQLLNIQEDNDWRSFASHLKFTNNEIKGIKTKAKQQDPAEALLDLMMERSGKAGFPLSVLQKLLEKTGRNDVAGIVGLLISEKSGAN